MVLTILFGCIEGFSGRAGRPIIEDLSKKEAVVYCTGNATDPLTCVDNYCTGESTDSVDCVDNFCTGDKTVDNTSCVENWCSGDETKDNTKCVVEKVLRPTDSIFIDRNYCSCKNGKPENQKS